ncbi:MAG: cupredoxin domain-containing protein [Ilumatobacteraceae bacterium]
MMTPNDPRQGTRRRTLVVAVLALAGLVACGDGEEVPEAALTAATPATTEVPRVGAALGVVNATYDFTIPDGAGAAIAAGDKRANVLPGSITAQVGESIRIENNDRQGHSVGPWYVGPNEILLQQFTAPGTFQGECTVHDSGRFVLVVEG